jgi:hypothetical protein
MLKRTDVTGRSTNKTFAVSATKPAAVEPGERRAMDLHTLPGDEEQKY